VIILKRICALPLENKYLEEQLLSYQSPTLQAMQTQGHVTYLANLDSVCNKIITENVLVRTAYIRQRFSCKNSYWNNTADLRVSHQGCTHILCPV